MSKRNSVFEIVFVAVIVFVLYYLYYGLCLTAHILDELTHFLLAGMFAITLALLYVGCQIRKLGNKLVKEKAIRGEE